MSSTPGGPLSANNPGQVVRTHGSVTVQYNWREVWPTTHITELCLQLTAKSGQETDDARVTELWEGDADYHGDLPFLFVTMLCVYACSAESCGLCQSEAAEPVMAAGLLGRLRQNFLSRAFCASLPLQLLAFVMLGFAAIVPLCEQDCVPPNSFLYSLHPLYRYTDGQPPVWWRPWWWWYMYGSHTHTWRTWCQRILFSCN